MRRLFNNPTTHLVGVLLLGLLLRLPKMTEPPWYDEVFTMRFASVSLDRLLPAVMGDVHPPLFYIIQWLNIRLFGTSEIALRLPSLALGVVAIWLVYRLALAYRLPTAAALLAALLLALTPRQIYYSNEARSYMLLAVVLLTALLTLVTDRPRLYAVAAGLIPLTHNVGYIYLAVLTLIAFGWRRQRWLLPILVSCLIGATWLPVTLRQSNDLSDGFWIVPLSPAGMVEPLLQLTVTREIPRAVMTVTYLPVLLATVLGIWHGRRWLNRPPGYTLAGLLLGVPLGLIVASLAWQPVYIARVMLPWGTLLPLLWAAGVWRSRWLTLLLIVALSGALAAYFSVPVKDNVRAPLSICHETTSVYTASLPAAFYAAYYLPDKTLSLWTEANDLMQTLSDETKSELGFVSIPFEQLEHPVCVVAFFTPLTRPEERAHLAQYTASAPRAAYQLNDEWRAEIFIVR